MVPLERHSPELSSPRSLGFALERILNIECGSTGDFFAAFRADREGACRFADGFCAANDEQYFVVIHLKRMALYDSEPQAHIKIAAPLKFCLTQIGVHDAFIPQRYDV
jgi:hypothetical protein